MKETRYATDRVLNDLFDGAVIEIRFKELPHERGKYIKVPYVIYLDGVSRRILMKTFKELFKRVLIREFLPNQWSIGHVKKRQDGGWERYDTFKGKPK